jgi:repressor LexA
MTNKQNRIFEIIKNFIEENKYSPTVREIGELANISSPSTVYGYLVVLEKKGYISMQKGKQRTIKLKGNNNETIY